MFSQRQSTGRGGGRRALKVLGVLAAGLLVLLAIAVLVLAFKPQLIADAVKSRVLPQMSAQLGRQVSVGPVHVGLFPPRARLEQVSIEGFPGGLPLAQAQSASASVELWPLVRSFGNEVRVKSVELVAPEINLVRGPDGRWNYEGLATEESSREVVVSVLRIKDGVLQIVERGAQARAVALRDIDLSVKNLAAGQPADLDLKAAFASDRQNVKMKMRLTPAASPGATAQADGTVDVDGVSLNRLRSLMPAGFAQTVTGGSLDVNLRVSSSPDGAYTMTGKGSAKDLQLRGNPAEGRLALAGTAHPGGTFQVTLSDIAVKGAGVDLGGTASVQGSQRGPIRGRFDLSGPLLELDTLLAALPEQQAAQASAPGEPLVPESMRKQLQNIEIAGRIAIGKIVNGKLIANDFAATGRLSKGVLRLDNAQAGFFGGKLFADGTEVRLTDAKPSWTLKAQLDSVDTGAAFQQLTGAAPLKGKLGGSLELKGAGERWEELRQTLTGRGAIELADGMLTSADLGAQLAPGLQQALKAMGKSAPAGGPVKAMTKGVTQLRDLAASFQVKDGWLRFARPVGFDSAFGKASLGGAIALDQKLDLDGKVLLSPEFVDQIAGGKFKPAGAIELPVGFAGSLPQPQVEPPAPKQVAVALAEQSPAAQQLRQGRKQAERKIDEERDAAKREARRRLRNLLP